MLLLRITLIIALLAVTEIACAVLSFPPKDKTAPENSHIFTADPRYEPWTDPSNVLYFIDENYTDFERWTVQGAMRSIAADMNTCINFREYDPVADSGKSYVYISKTLNDGTSPPTCVTFFGHVKRATVGQGQKMVLRGGPNGCLDNVRETMKVIVNVLGLRNEYRRPDRNRFMVVNPENMIPDLQGTTLLTSYNETDVYYSTPFDYHSLTMLPNTKYAMANRTIYSFPSNVNIPDMDYLSINDCLGLSWLYGCDTTKCKDPYSSPPIVATTSPSPRATNVIAKPVPASTSSQNPAFNFVLLKPDSTAQGAATAAATANSTGTDHGISASGSASSSSGIVFRVLSNGNTTSQLQVFGQGQVPNTLLNDPTLNSRVNISITYPQINSSSQNFVLDKSHDSANASQQTGLVTLHLENTSNATAYVGIYGPPGFTGSFITALNNSAVVFNSTQAMSQGVALVTVSGTTGSTLTSPLATTTATSSTTSTSASTTTTTAANGTTTASTVATSTVVVDPTLTNRVLLVP